MEEISCVALAFQVLLQRPVEWTENCSLPNKSVGHMFIDTE